MEEEKVLDYDLVVAFIKEKLEDQDIVVSEDLIREILCLETDYMIQEGFAEIIEEDE
jgi:hypothetical protein